MKIPTLILPRIVLVTVFILQAHVQTSAAVLNYIDAESATINGTNGTLTDNGKSYVMIAEGEYVMPKLNSMLKRAGSYSIEYTTNADVKGAKERVEHYLIKNDPINTTRFSGFSFRLSYTYFPAAGSSSTHGTRARPSLPPSPSRSSPAPRM